MKRSVAFQSIACFLALVPTWLAAEPSRPPAYVHCALYVGETELFEGACRVTKLNDGQILIKEDSRYGYSLLIHPLRERDLIYWNGARNNKKPDKILGEAQWFDHCWQSILHSQIAFSLCLIPNMSKNEGL